MNTNQAPEAVRTEAARHVHAAIDAIRAVADAIRELKRVPSGTLYSALIGKMGLPAYEKIIGILKDGGLVKEVNHELIWIEPAPAPEGKAKL